MQGWDLDNALGFWLHLTQNRVRNQAEQLMAPLGVTPEQWAILVRLWQKDDLPQSDLAELTFRDKGSVTRLIDGLERRGYVARARDPRDARSHRILLTREGRDLEKQLLPLVQRFVARWTRGIGGEDLAVTLRTLRALYRNLD